MKLVGRGLLSLVTGLLVVVGLAAVGPAQAAPRPAAPGSASIGPIGDGGYWLAGADGGVSDFGAAAAHGSTVSSLAAPIVGMASTPSGGGYWLVASDGGVFAFGDAVFLGSMGGRTLAKPIVGMASTPSGDGYWLVASDGGIFTFGDAVFHGSTGAVALTKPIVGMAASDDGYWLVGSDGGIFTFGDAVFHGSTGASALTKPIVGMARALGVTSPTVTAVNPSSGPSGGGTVVTLTGSGFGATTTVAFGARAASTVVILSATHLRATSPSGSGTIDVTVSTAGASSGLSSADRFSYGSVPDAPTDVTAEDGFSCTLLVTLAPAGIGSSPITSYTVSAQSGGYVFTAPGVPVLGRISIDLTNIPNGTYTFTAHATNAVGDSPESLPSNSAMSANCGTPPPATVTSLSPTSGPVAGGTTVTITGTGFTGATMVSFGGLFATNVVVVSDTMITAVSPPGVAAAPPVDVVVPGQGGPSTTGPGDLFTYLPNLDVPTAPPKPTATISCHTATVVFSAPSSVGGSPIVSYTATSTGGYTGSSLTVAPITVLGLFPGSYTFTVHATNSFGSGPESPPSDPVNTTACG